jgi:hypothetical protein
MRLKKSTLVTEAAKSVRLCGLVAVAQLVRPHPMIPDNPIWVPMTIWFFERNDQRGDQSALRPRHIGVRRDRPLACWPRAD